VPFYKESDALDLCGREQSMMVLELASLQHVLCFTAISNVFRVELRDRLPKYAVVHSPLVMFRASYCRLHSSSNLIPATPNPLFSEKRRIQSPNNIASTPSTTITSTIISKRSAISKTKLHCETEKSEPQHDAIFGLSRSHGPGED